MFPPKRQYIFLNIDPLFTLNGIIFMNGILRIHTNRRYFNLKLKSFLCTIEADGIHREIVVGTVHRILGILCPEMFQNVLE